MIKTLQKVVATAGTPVQIHADYNVERQLPVCIKAKRTNSGYIMVAGSAAEAKSGAAAFYELSARDTVTVQVRNLNEIWIGATSSGDGVEVIFEDDRKA